MLAAAGGAGSNFVEKMTANTMKQNRSTAINVQKAQIKKAKIYHVID